METEEVKRLIEVGIPGSQVTVTGDGRHFEALVISGLFAGKTPLQKQRMVMDTVRPQLESEELHALSIKALAL
ncbi:MAG: BolA/IbaG family iron-sulfur metabolism protein [Gammaproteobacteria bacterium]|nr:BolA/IbaG family iron-sulfur metabolism protein [Gammaproteobacteria bacterium]